jgi:hypothetical protein
MRLITKDGLGRLESFHENSFIGIKDMVKDTWIPISVIPKDDGRDIGDKTQAGAVKWNIINRIIISNEEERPAKDLTIIVKGLAVISNGWNRLQECPLSPKSLHCLQPHNNGTVAAKGIIWINNQWHRLIQLTLPMIQRDIRRVMVRWAEGSTFKGIPQRWTMVSDTRSLDIWGECTVTVGTELIEKNIGDRIIGSNEIERLDKSLPIIVKVPFV